MKFGLDDSAVSAIQETLRRHPEVARAKIFGSRAEGTAAKNSDIDIALWGDIDARLLGRIRGELDDLPLPYLFDLVAYDAIRNPALRRQVEECAGGLFPPDSAAENEPR